MSAKVTALISYLPEIGPVRSVQQKQQSESTSALGVLASSYYASNKMQTITSTSDVHIQLGWLHNKTTPWLIPNCP